MSSGDFGLSYKCKGIYVGKKSSTAVFLLNMDSNFSLSVEVFFDFVFTDLLVRLIGDF